MRNKEIWGYRNPSEINKQPLFIIRLFIYMYIYIYIYYSMGCQQYCYFTQKVVKKVLAKFNFVKILALDMVIKVKINEHCEIKWL